MVNHVYDALVEGTTARHINGLLSTMTGIPLVQEQTETVEQISVEPLRTIVITNAHTYVFRDVVNLTVAVGDKVRAGDSLIDAFEIFEINRGQCPDTDEVRQLAMGPGFLARGYFQDLVFENVSKPVVVELDVDGYTKVSWELSGWPGDVEKFFDDMHADGVAKGETMAMLLDVRANPVGQPGAASLPATVNPLCFLIANILRDHALIVKLNTAHFGTEALGLNRAANLFRKVMPPQTALILCVGLAHQDEPIIMEGPGTDSDPGYTESVAVYLGMERAESIDPAASISESVRIKRIGGRCQ